MKISIIPLLLPIILLTPYTSHSQENSPSLRADWEIDIPITAASSIILLSYALTASERSPRICNWCASNPMDDKITDTFSWSKPKYASKTSDIIAFIAIPALSLSTLTLNNTLTKRYKELPHDFMIMAEILAFSTLANQITKYAVRRQRPYMHRNNEELYQNKHDHNLSFYSGHTSFAFAFVVGAATIAHYRKYKSAPYIWAIGLSLATSVAYLRIAAQKHYFSDVLVGAGVASLLAFLIPYLHLESNAKLNIKSSKNQPLFISYQMNF